MEVVKVVKVVEVMTMTGVVEGMEVVEAKSKNYCRK